LPSQLFCQLRGDTFGRAAGGPAGTAHRGLDAMKIENADELAFFYSEE
jgi:hypothetical protein